MTNMKEQWKQILGFDRYDVSNCGRVRSWAVPNSIYFDRRTSESRILKQFPSQQGYLSVSLYKGYGKKAVRIGVHILVALAFLGPCPHGMQVAHLDESRTNSRLDNLRYMTPHGNSMMPKHRKRISKGRFIGKLGFHGITQCKKRWRAQINVSGKIKHLGVFDTPQEAAHVWDRFVQNHRLLKITNMELGLFNSNRKEK